MLRHMMLCRMSHGFRCLLTCETPSRCRRWRQGPVHRRGRGTAPPPPRSGRPSGPISQRPCAERRGKVGRSWVPAALLAHAACPRFCGSRWVQWAHLVDSRERCEVHAEGPSRSSRPASQRRLGLQILTAGGHDGRIPLRAAAASPQAVKHWQRRFAGPPVAVRSGNTQLSGLVKEAIGGIARPPRSRAAKSPLKCMLRWWALSGGTPVAVSGPKWQRRVIVHV